MKLHRPKGLANAIPVYQWIKFILMFCCWKIGVVCNGIKCYLACINRSYTKSYYTVHIFRQIDQIEIFNILNLYKFFGVSFLYVAEYLHLIGGINEGIPFIHNHLRIKWPHSLQSKKEAIYAQHQVYNILAGPQLSNWLILAVL